MANYHPNAKSLVYGLSDFWTLYFRELPTLEELYRGMEVEVGQAYLDLMALFLNNSVQDATLFNKQFFKLLRLREDTVTYAADGTYGVPLDTDVAGVKYLNNKVFNVSASLERGPDFVFDADTRSALFPQDPFSAYRARTFGQFTVTSRVRNPEASLITLELVDAAVHPPTLSRSQYALTVSFDSTRTTALDVIALLNTDVLSKDLVRATLSGAGDGTGLVAPIGATALQRQATAPLEGFATRTFGVAFGTRFTDSAITRWTDLPIEKGDVLRILGGAGYGAPQEFPIALVRDGSLLLYPQACPENIAGGLSYAVLRSPTDDQVRDEPFAVSGTVSTLDTNATITASSSTITFSAPTSLNEFHVGQTVLLGSALNAGQYIIRDVVSSTEITVSGGALVDETGVTVELNTVISASTLSGCTLTGSTFTFPPATFPAVAGGVLVISRAGAHEKYEILGTPTATTFLLDVPEGTLDGVNLGAALVPNPSTSNDLVYEWPLPGTVEVAARRFFDGQAVMEGRDFTVNYDLGIVQPITPWEPSTLHTVSYRYRVAQHVGTNGAADVTDVEEPVTEIGVWATDALIDKYHLYFTYGYLINRIERSTESYRSLIRGIFQLFMLGPTLERFESAINIVAGLPVIRDDGEILLSYSSGALRQGTDGSFDATTRTFSSPTAAFTTADLSNKIYVSSGLNASKLFRIQAVIDATTVELVETPISDTGSAWEITNTGTHTITTSRASYEYPRGAPLKKRFTEPANMGVLELRAFEVVTAAFEVTDHVESPYWWETAQIPETLVPDLTSRRRQSTTQLFENIINPGDDGRVGDPGFFVGADSEGGTIPRTVLRTGAGADGILYGDPLYPISTTETFFEAASGNFTDSDIGNYIRIDGTEYLITSRISFTRVKIQAWLPLPYNGSTPATWELVTGTLPLRHTAAYIIFDRWLKYHLFTVRFDGFLLDSLEQDVLLDLQELVFAAKPIYTQLALRPSLFFNEIIRVLDDNFTTLSRHMLGGQNGTIVAANTNPLTIGPHWSIGSWYRYVANSGTFAAPAATVANVLGVPPAGYERRPTTVILGTDFARGGAPVPYDEPVFFDTGFGGSNATIVMDGDRATLSVNDITKQITPDMLHQYMLIGGQRYRIGRIDDTQTAVLYAPSGLVDAVGVTWEYSMFGARDGLIYHDATGQSILKESSGRLDFTGFEGAYARAAFPSDAGHQIYRIDAPYLAGSAYVRKKYYLTREGQPLIATTTSGSSQVALNTPFFTADMTYLGRLAADPSTSLQKRFYVEFVSGPDTGLTRELHDLVSEYAVTVTGAVTDAANVQVAFYCLESYDETHAGSIGVWHLQRQSVYVDTYAAAPDTLHLPTDVDADASIAYDAAGVQVPSVPFTAAFDAAAGDTYYTVGGIDPHPQFMRTRSARDMDLLESPVQITRTNVP